MSLSIRREKRPPSLLGGKREGRGGGDAAAAVKEGWRWWKWQREGMERVLHWSTCDSDSGVVMVAMEKAVARTTEKAMEAVLPAVLGSALQHCDARNSTCNRCLASQCCRALMECCCAQN